MSLPRELLILLLAGWSSGISVYLSAGLLGLSDRMGWVHLPGELDVFSNPLVFVSAFLLFIIEFVADKVPYFDSIWDSVHTLIRPLGGFAIGYLAGSEHGQAVQILYGMLTGTMTLDMHIAKAAGRLAINTSPEPFSNIAASTAEQSLVILMYWFFMKHPVLAGLIIIAILILAFFVICWLWKFVKKIFGGQKAVPRAVSG